MVDLTFYICHNCVGVKGLSCTIYCILSKAIDVVQGMNYVVSVRTFNSLVIYMIEEVITVKGGFLMSTAAITAIMLLLVSSAALMRQRQDQNKNDKDKKK